MAKVKFKEEAVKGMMSDMADRYLMPKAAPIPSMAKIMKDGLKHNNGDLEDNIKLR